VEESDEIMELKEKGNALRKKISIIENNLKGELKIFHQNL